MWSANGVTQLVTAGFLLVETELLYLLTVSRESGSPSDQGRWLRLRLRLDMIGERLGSAVLLVAQLILGGISCSSRGTADSGWDQLFFLWYSWCSVGQIFYLLLNSWWRYWRDDDQLTTCQQTADRVQLFFWMWAADWTSFSVSRLSPITELNQQFPNCSWNLQFPDCC